ncbi:MAG: hypothetical protein KGL39_36770 [Patescibacteria group bacterium]|nr:hypothetical protein [Patescibacteria group bacterium]
MNVASNISAVLERTRRLQSRIPLALHKALSPDWWRPKLEREAKATVDANAGNTSAEERGAFVGTLSVIGVTGGMAGFFASLNRPGKFGGGIEMQGDLEGRLDPVTFATDADRQRFKDLIYSWVENEKRWDIERDGEKNMETVARKADWFYREMTAPQSAAITDKESSHQGQPVRDVVLPDIADYIAKLKKADALVKLDPATLESWFRAVLAAWRRLARDLFRQKFRAELSAGSF